MNELILTVVLEPLEEGGFLATSDELQGLIAQGRTVAETLEIAQDVARRLIESYVEHGDPLPANIAHAIRHPQRRTRTKIPVGFSLDAVAA